MIRRIRILLGLTALVFLILMGSGSVQAQCIPTGFFLDSINMTAALINPTTTVTGSVNADGCNIGAFSPSWFHPRSRPNFSLSFLHRGTKTPSGPLVVPRIFTANSIALKQNKLGTLDRAE
jgi:hypothetical protein